MTRDELLDKICLTDSIADCCSSDYIFECDDCKVTLGYILDEYEADIRAEVIDEIKELMKKYVEFESIDIFVEALSKLRSRNE